MMIYVMATNWKFGKTVTLGAQGSLRARRSSGSGWLFPFGVGRCHGPRFSDTAGHSPFPSGTRVVGSTCGRGDGSWRPGLLRGSAAVCPRLVQQNLSGWPPITRSEVLDVFWMGRLGVDSIWHCRECDGLVDFRQKLGAGEDRVCAPNSSRSTAGHLRHHPLPICTVLACCIADCWLVCHFSLACENGGEMLWEAGLFCPADHRRCPWGCWSSFLWPRHRWGAWDVGPSQIKERRGWWTMASD